MSQVLTNDFSPVNVEERKEIGVRAGDTVRVHQKIEEKGKTRIQVFEGIVLAVKHGNEPGATFTVRRVSSGVGVERIFPLYSPLIDKIEIVKRARVRRSKLYYIRKKVAREIRRQMRNARFMDRSTMSESEAEAKRQAEEEEKKKEEENTAEETEKETEDTQASSEDEGNTTEESEKESTTEEETPKEDETTEEDKKEG
ncbi:MAG: 50S ribosomal protein L19 [Candidatus Campbellbacteria bacterium]|nr:50S ribosomal protein L19 [Candidatus Campbellbacteria bacterium]